MQIRSRAKLSGVPGAILLCSILLIWFPGFIIAGTVTLDSLEIYNTHELFGFKPDVYFQCKGENKTTLPDVKEKNTSYAFKGEESWQPLTEIFKKKCKRCGIYGHHTLKPDDVFDEWELCASDFTSDDGKYTRIKDGEFNATFSCPECTDMANAAEHSPGAHDSKKGMHWALVLLIVAVVLGVAGFGAVAGYMYWQKRRKQQWQKRRKQQEQARYLQKII